MPLPDPAGKLNDAPFTDLMRILLQQFKRLLITRNIELTDHEIQRLAEAIARRDVSSRSFQQLRAAMRDLVDESIQLLQAKFGFTFEESLYSAMDDITGWETTAEFLEIANEKANAELRIAAGSALLTAMDDLNYTTCLFTVIEKGAGRNDIEAVFARRVLLHISEVDPEAPDWLRRTQDWIQNRQA